MELAGLSTAQEGTSATSNHSGSKKGAEPRREAGTPPAVPAPGHQVQLEEQAPSRSAKWAEHGSVGAAVSGAWGALLPGRGLAEGPTSGMAMAPGPSRTV